MSGIVLVTGGAGFVGKALVDKLRRGGHAVRSFDLATPTHADDIQGSIVDANALQTAMIDVTTVYHLAGNAQLWARDNSAFETVNRVGTQMVVDAARDANVHRFIHCSSLTTLVGRSTPVGPSDANETIALPPDDMLGPYPRSKREAELIIEDAARDGFHASIALPTEPLGAGDTSLTPPTKMILDFANQKTPAFIDCILNFVPINSLVDGLIAVHENGAPGERYLLGGANTPLAELLAMVGTLTGTRMPTTQLPYWVALATGIIDTNVIARLSGKPPTAPLTGVRLAGRRVSFSSQKAARELNWRAGSLSDALSEMLTWARREGLLKEV